MARGNRNLQRKFERSRGQKLAYALDLADHAVMYHAELAAASDPSKAAAIFADRSRSRTYAEHVKFEASKRRVPDVRKNHRGIRTVYGIDDGSTEGEWVSIRNL